MLSDREFLKRETKRLSGLKAFPPLPEAVNEITEALATAATEAEVTAFVSRWLRASDECPRPAEIYCALADATGDTPQTLDAPRCPSCDGTGWKIVTRGHLSAARRCECRVKSATQEVEEDGNESQRTGATAARS